MIINVVLNDGSAIVYCISRISLLGMKSNFRENVTIISISCADPEGRQQV